MSQINNYKGMLIRQTMTGIFKEPTERYLDCLNTQRSIAAQLSSVSGQEVRIDNGHGLEIELTMKVMMSNYVYDNYDALMS